MVDGAHITVVTVKMHLSFVQVSSQPRPYGFSLKKKKKKTVGGTRYWSMPGPFPTAAIF